jgi:predicted dehydrogenase
MKRLDQSSVQIMKVCGVPMTIETWQQQDDIRPETGREEATIHQWIVPSKRSQALRIGVVGCGYWGAKHVRVLSSLGDVDEVVLIDPDSRSRELISSTFPGAVAFPSLDAALPHVDAVVIATPPRSHTALVLQALRSGKHVLVEKPLTTTSADARLVVDEGHRSDRVLMVGHTFEFNPAVRELRRRLDQGELGEVYYVHSSRFNIDLYRSDVNVIWDLAPHDISILNYLLRSVPTSVTAWGSSGGHVDAAYVRLDYARIGVIGYVHVSWLDPQKVRQVTVVGRNKVASYNDMDTEERLRIFERSAESSDSGGAESGWPPSYRYGDSSIPSIQFKEPLVVEDQHFVDYIRNNATPQTNGFNGLVVVATLEAAEQSLRVGGPVELDLPDDPATADAPPTHSLGVAEARA